MKKLKKIRVQGTSEIFQSLDIKFAFVKKIDKNNFEQISNPIKCRDFLGDCIWNKLTNKVAQIYGFSYSYKENPFDEDKLRLSLTFPHNEYKTYFIDNFGGLTNKETKYKISNSKCYETDCPETLIVEANKVWQSCIWKISLYTFFLKCISYKTIKDLESPEDEYIDYLKPEIEDKLMKKIRVKKEFLADSIGKAHNYSGFVSVIRNQNEEMNKLLLG